MQTLWPTARDKFAEGLIDWDGDSFLLVALDSTYTYDAAHEFRDDLTGVLGTASLVNTSIASGGACDADDTSLSGPTVGQTVRAIAICKDTGVAATDDLIYFASTQTDGTNILRVSDGVNPITFVWSNSITRIFRV